MSRSGDSLQTTAALAVLALGIGLLALPGLLARRAAAQNAAPPARGRASPAPAQGECTAAAAQAKQWLDDYRGGGGLLAQAYARVDDAMRTGLACPELYIERARLLMKTGGLRPMVLKTAEEALRAKA